MRSIVLVLLLTFGISTGQNSVEGSFLHTGDDWRIKDAALKASILNYLGGPEVDSTNHIYVLAQYKHVGVSDSAIKTIVVSFADSVIMAERFYDPSVDLESGNVLLTWWHFKKPPGKKVSFKEETYAGWNGGPWAKRIPTLRAMDKFLASHQQRDRRKWVDSLVMRAKDKSWKDGTGKNIPKGQIRKYAWRAKNKWEVVKVDGNIVGGKK